MGRMIGANWARIVLEYQGRPEEQALAGKLASILWSATSQNHKSSDPVREATRDNQVIQSEKWPGLQGYSYFPPQTLIAKKQQITFKKIIFIISQITCNLVTL